MGFLALQIDSHEEVCVGDVLVIRAVVDRDGNRTEEIVMGNIRLRVSRDRDRFLKQILVDAPREIPITSQSKRPISLSPSVRSARRSWRGRPQP